jgi:hypothetical protein
MKSPSAADFRFWKRGLTAPQALKPGQGAGKYEFEAKLRNTNSGKHTAPSPILTLSVAWTERLDRPSRRICPEAARVCCEFAPGQTGIDTPAGPASLGLDPATADPTSHGPDPDVARICGPPSGRTKPQATTRSAPGATVKSISWTLPM